RRLSRRAGDRVAGHQGRPDQRGRRVGRRASGHRSAFCEQPQTGGPARFLPRDFAGDGGLSGAGILVCRYYFVGPRSYHSVEILENWLQFGTSDDSNFDPCPREHSMKAFVRGSIAFIVIAALVVTASALPPLPKYIEEHYSASPQHAKFLEMYKGLEMEHKCD